MEIYREDGAENRYQEAKGEYYEGSSFIVRRMFDIRDEGVHFIGVTQAAFDPPYDGCRLNLYLGQPLVDNFVPLTDYFEDPFLHLNDPSDGSSLRVVTLDDINSDSNSDIDSKFRDSGNSWACITPVVSTSRVPIEEAEEYILRVLPEIMEAARNLSRHEDLFVPNLDPEAQDADDFAAQAMSWDDLQFLPPGQKVSSLARSFRGSFEWENLDVDSKHELAEWESEDAKRVRGEVKWNPPEKHPMYASRPHADFVDWLDGYAKNSGKPPSPDAVLNCWEAALVIAVMVGNLDPSMVKRDAEVGDPQYVIKYFASGQGHYDLKSLRNDISVGDFIGLVDDDELTHVGVVVQENKEDYREIVTMSLFFHDNNRFTKIKWGKVVKSSNFKLEFGSTHQADEPPTGSTGTYFLYGPFTT